MDGMGQGVEIKASLWLRDAVCVWGGGAGSFSCWWSLAAERGCGIVVAVCKKGEAALNKLTCEATNYWIKHSHKVLNVNRHVK